MSAAEALSETAAERRNSRTSENSADGNVLEQRDEGAGRTVCQWAWHVVKSISVEPTMFLYMFAFMITSVVEQNFFLYKSCRVNNNFTEEICRNLNKPENKEFKDQSLLTNAWFLQWENISAHIFPIILALFLGSFSDRRGRKLPLLMGLVGKFVYSSMVVVNARMPTWPVQNIIYSATLPSALTGADVAIFASCFAYISDISTLQQRTIRVTILDVVYLSAMPLGVALGSHLFYNVFDQSYADMFTVNASLIALAIIYSLCALKWQTTPKQRSLRELGCCGFWGDFFDKQHVKDSLAVLVKSRKGHRRSFLIILLVSMALYTFQRDEGQYLYMYTLDKFDWDVSAYSNFKTFKSSAYVIAMLLAVPLMNKVLGWRDTTIIFIGTWAHSIARLFFYFATNTDLLYAGAVVCSLGPIVGPMIRAMTSKIVPTSERGKVFALLSVCDNAVPFISGVCYSQLYRATKSNNYGGNVFMLTIATQMAVFVMILCIHVVLGKNSLAVPEVPENESGLIGQKEPVPQLKATADQN
ncbi:proton-coupled folate transporter [Drosophila ficusphila]|uniref:proton-coupled folate transporter n=1 Tax=Drosophila ficusphila TaxID=30025 RepID=UPI0007E6A17E|nr:proton-coupled folate transporter [Drosophila ficusphila]XP_017043049.1 proton-coupled folate transporter [Drosophila ficusphila]XP_017043050.1 proton-coupled folate transporter [Drosophila ficusphila]XP_017043051.1 proton-coupled folate transporter [Drosophila ficusphila]XP_043063643.1 proton-coupled folate transporter [Drosophila ficusphila]